MRILFSCSRDHFDPQARTNLTCSVSWIARGIYEACRELGDVTYMDPGEASLVEDKRFDLLIGQIDSFETICRRLRPRRSILFMATTHPENRNGVVKPEARERDVPASATTSGEWAGTLSCADLILQGGGDAGLRALTRAGVERSRILNIHYGVDHVPFENERVFAKPYRFLVFATERGLGKGILRAIEVFRGLEGDYQLTLAGRIAGPDYAQVVERATRQDSRIRYVGWVEAGTPEYFELLRQHHFYISTSLEEEEQGTLLEALSSGLVPITTPELGGVSYSPLGSLSLAQSDTALLSQALSLSEDQLRILSRQSRHYVDTFHSWASFKARIREVVEHVVEGDFEGLVRPRVSLVLSVFNKEAQVIRLLRQLHQSVRSYENYDLHLIFDGCIDRSRERAKSYLSTLGMDVKYYDTPNVFETRANNIGLRAAGGKYCILLQDDVYVYESHWLEKIVHFMETNPAVGAVGGLAGVFYYPAITEQDGPATSAHQFESSRRIETGPGGADPDNLYEVDAVMRGPIVLRKRLLEAFGYLDERSFAPYYMDDMDLCMRLRARGYPVFYYPLDAVNERATIAKYDSARAARWDRLVDDHLRLFYDRWDPGQDKSSYLCLPKPRFSNLYEGGLGAKRNHKQTRPSTGLAARQRRRLARALRHLRAVFDNELCASLAERMWKKRVLWTQEQIAFLPEGTRVLDVGAGPGYYRGSFSHCRYTSMDISASPEHGEASISVVGDPSALPFSGKSFEVVFLTEVVEHLSRPRQVLGEIARVTQLGGGLILTPPLGSAHQTPYPFSGGYTRHFCEKTLPEFGFEADTIEPNGGLFGHLVEMNGRAFSYIEQALQAPWYRPLRYLLALTLRNIPAVVYSALEERVKVEDSTVGYRVVAKRLPAPIGPKAMGIPH